MTTNESASSPENPPVAKVESVAPDRVAVEFRIEDLVKRVSPDVLSSHCGGCYGCSGCSH